MRISDWSSDVCSSDLARRLNSSVRAHMKHFGYLLALLLSIPTFAAGAPPVEYPQACAPTYCVQIIATHPDQPQKFVIQHTAKMGTATMTVELGRGFFVAFNSKHVDSRLLHAPSEKRV